MVYLSLLLPLLVLLTLPLLERLERRLPGDHVMEPASGTLASSRENGTGPTVDPGESQTLGGP
jgi:hypothetical protein